MDIEKLQKYRKNFDGQLSVAQIDSLFEYIKELEEEKKRLSGLFEVAEGIVIDVLPDDRTDAEDDILDLVQEALYPKEG